MIDNTKPWLRENLEDARREFEKRPEWQKVLHKQYLENIASRAKVTIEREEDREFYFD